MSSRCDPASRANVKLSIKQTVRKTTPFSEKIYSAEKSDDSVVAICYREKFLESVVYTNKIRPKVNLTSIFSVSFT